MLETRFSFWLAILIEKQSCNIEHIDIRGKSDTAKAWQDERTRRCVHVRFLSVRIHRNHSFELICVTKQISSFISKT